VVVHQYHVAGFDQRFGQQVFRGAPLMCRDDEPEAEHVLDGVCQLEEAFTAGVGVIRLHHGGQLVIAHGIGAAVSQHVQKDVLGTQ